MTAVAEISLWRCLSVFVAAGIRLEHENWGHKLLGYIGYTSKAISWVFFIPPDIRIAYTAENQRLRHRNEC